MARKKKGDEIVPQAPGTMTRAEKLAAIDRLSEKWKDEVTGDSVFRTMGQCDRGVEVFSTRTPSLDIALGVGGVPRGRVTEVFGAERGGKTTLAMQVAASCQEAGGIIVYIDSEHSLDAVYCKKIGLDVEDPGFIIVQEEIADKALDAATEMLKAGVVDLVVIDSLANLMPSVTSERMKEARDKGESGVGKKVVGVKAAMLTQFIEDVIGAIHRHGTCMFNVQQERIIMGPGQQPRADSATQIRSVRHNTSIRIRATRTGDIEGTGNKTDETYKGEAQETLAKVVKNKVGPPFRQALYSIAYGVGVQYWKDLVESCEVHGVKNVIPGGKYTIVDDNGEILGKFYAKRTDEFFADPANNETGIMLVDKLSAAVGIHLWDPIRMTEGGTRRIGPYSPEELDAVGGTLIDGLNFEESAEEAEVVDIAL